MGEGHTWQHGGFVHEAVAFVEIYIPAGQRTVSFAVEAGDSRPSGNTARMDQSEYGGPSCPLVNGLHCNVMSDKETEVNSAGQEKEVRPDVSGRNTHAAWVTLGTVNNGK